MAENVIYHEILAKLASYTFVADKSDIAGYKNIRNLNDISKERLSIIESELLKLLN